MCSHRWLLVACLMYFAVASARAGQTRVLGGPSRDVEQTIQARKVLADDPQLASCNIGVTVTDRVAVLWGPVPSAEVAFRAELCLKALNQLVEVRNELVVSEPLEPTRRPFRLDNPPQFLPELLPPRLPEEPRPLSGAPAFLMGQDKGDPQKVRATSAAKKIPLEIAPPQATAKAGEPTEGDQELAAAIRILLQSKTTYNAVQFAVQNRRVYLKTSNQDSDALHEAARAIARLPNVDGVVLVENTLPR
jgi:BON domain